MVIKGKGGIFFTTIVLVMLSLFVLSYAVYSQANERKVVEKRISTMNSFLMSAEQDIERQIYISGYRIIFLLEKRIIDSNSYISDLNSTFNEAFFNGTIDGESQILLNGVTFGGVVDFVNTTANKLNLQINLLNASVNISQENPWNVKFTIHSKLTMEDRGGLAYWNKNFTISADIPIYNFEDPLYYINTDGKVSNLFAKSPFSIFTQENDVSNLSSHSLNSYYIASPTAPSFLDRLQGITTPNPNGIESLVNLQELAQQGITALDKSVVDYIYFSTSNPSASHIIGMPSWFKLDSEHLDVYNASGLVG